MTAKEFLTKIEMYYGQQPFEQIKGDILTHMENGLQGKNPGLHMIPTYISATGDIPRNERTIVIDAGGTNLRVALVYFNSEGKPVVEAFEKMKMPGTNGEIDVDTFFFELAQSVLPYCDRAQGVGFCFSYVCEIQPNKDGKLLRFCKEVRVRNSEGIFVCERLEAALKKLGAPGTRRYRLINDTVAAMLGAKAVTDNGKYADYIGFILGTGTNMCYNDNCSDITKNKQIAQMPGKMAINMESGCFEQLLRGKADLIVDAESDVPNDHIAEKMISGGYFGKILYRTLALAAESGALGNAFSKELGKNENHEIDMKEIDDFCKNPHSCNYVTSLCADDAEVEFCSEVVDALFERAARVSAAFLASIADKTGEGREKPFCVCVEGTTIIKNPILLPKIKKYLETNCDAQFDFITVDQTTLFGTAVAGLIG